MDRKRDGCAAALKNHVHALRSGREVLATQQRFIGKESIDVAIARLDLANVLNADGQHAEAESLARQAADALSRNLGPNNGMVVLARIHVGDALRGQGRFADAESLLLAGYERFRTRTSFNANWRATALAALMRLRDAQGHRPRPPSIVR